MHLVAFALVYIMLAGFTLLAGANAIGSIRMALWKRRHRRVVDRVSRRSSTTLAEHYAGRRAIW